MFLLARAFSSGCAALTGVEAISNGVPAFRKPKSKNAATTLLLLGTIAITMMLSIIVLANQMGLKYVDPHDLDRLTGSNGEPLPAGYDQHTVIAQIARGGLRRLPARLLLRDRGDRASSWCWPPTPPSTASRCSARSWPRTATCRGRSAPAATGWPTATASSSWPCMAIVLIHGLRRRDDPADPALHRRRLRVVQPQPARHDPALDPAPEDRDRPGRAAPDDAVAGDQHRRPGA